MSEIETTARRLNVHGLVQGVGFRPFVYRLAHRFSLTGTVANNGQGVHIHVHGPAAAVDNFIAALQSEAPPVARIAAIDVHAATGVLEGEAGFRILPSCSGGQTSVPIAPDIATCKDCLAEILDPGNRRYYYPFTNCTNCGPRFSIVERIPYDRPNTSMRVFPMCAACRREYHDPLDRRFHAQPNACPSCGPCLSWHDHNGAPLAGDALALAAAALNGGAVVAIKGLGGFHLAVDAGSQAAVATLRTRKYRRGKPLAIMVRDLEAVAEFCHLSDEETALLTAPEHPIVLLKQRRFNRLAALVAPGLDVLGVMLPATPLHHLLFQQGRVPAALVMTSGNRSDEPICTGNDEALRRLHGLADFFLLHDREIVTRVDDSVARIMAGKIRLLRRARGYAPVPLPLRQPTADILACGAEVKNSFCLVRDQQAYLSQHIGELTGPENFAFYRESIAHFNSILAVTPEQSACDLHPDYLSTRFAHGRKLPCRAVQHHHAHIGAVLAEHGLDGPVLGVVLDGAGFGPDGTVFGGEIYRADRSGYVRLGRLSHLLLPGGDQAAREPWRMALALLYQGLGQAAFANAARLPALAAVPEKKQQLLAQMLVKKLNCPSSSSCGRLFDAVAALTGLCLYSEYEGQAAMLLEAWAAQVPSFATPAAYPLSCHKQDGLWIIDSASLAEHIVRDLGTEMDAAIIARRFHLWLVESLVTVLLALQRQTELQKVVLSGGCMQNKLLFETLVQRLEEHDCSVLAGELVPMNDGGIALGQAYTGGRTLCV